MEELKIRSIKLSLSLFALVFLALSGSSQPDDMLAGDAKPSWGDSVGSGSHHDGGMHNERHNHEPDWLSPGGFYYSYSWTYPSYWYSDWYPYSNYYVPTYYYSTPINYIDTDPWWQSPWGMPYYKSYYNGYYSSGWHSSRWGGFF